MMKTASPTRPRASSASGRSSSSSSSSASSSSRRHRPNTRPSRHPPPESQLQPRREAPTGRSGPRYFSVMTQTQGPVIPDELSQEDFTRIYGPVAPLSLPEVKTLFDGAPFRWWICGGWSLELGPSPRRAHEDVEVGIARRDLPAVRGWLSSYHVWDIHAGTLTYLWPKLEVPDDHEQLWVRRDAFSPWLMDLMLTPIDGQTWQYKRDPRLTRPFEDAITAGADGIPRQRPEIGLLFKARRRAPRDEEDFAAVVPTLTSEDRAWLRDAIALTAPPDTPWLERLSDR